MPFGFAQDLIRLNDLRMYVATVGQGKEREKIVSTLMDDPTLMVTAAGQHKIFRLNPENIKKSQDFFTRCSHQACTYAADGQPLPMGSRYPNSTCVIVGAGEGFDPDFVAQAKEAGASIIALGNAIHMVQDADIWVGVRRPPAYVNTGFTSATTLAIYPEEYKDDKLWLNTAHAKNWSATPVSACPNMAFFSLKDAQAAHGTGVDKFIENPSISTLGVHTSVSVGLTFAAHAGFRNIIMHGVSFSDKYCFDEEVHTQTAMRKVHTYGLFQREVFQKLWTALSDRYVTIWATPDVPLPAMRMEDNDQLIASMQYANRFNKAVNNISGISEPEEDKLKAIEKLKTVQQNMLNPSHIGDSIQELLDKWPKRLKGREIAVAAKTSYEVEVSKKGTCKGCARNKLFLPVYTLLVNAIEKAEGKARSPVNQLWKKVFPETLAVMHNGKRIFHPAFPKEDRA